jgi:GNAT superfamily N-acetyltransferase
MHFKLLADCPELIPQIASWYFEEWGHLRKDTGSEYFQTRLERSLNRDSLPLVILALENEQLAGVAELKIREMDIFPEKEHWLGGVYVPAENRRKGVGSKIIQQAIRNARGLGISTLYLQTERSDGGVYASLGWTPIDKASNHGLDVLIMENRLDERRAELEKATEEK